MPKKVLNSILLMKTRELNFPLTKAINERIKLIRMKKK